MHVCENHKDWGKRKQMLLDEVDEETDPFPIERCLNYTLRGRCKSGDACLSAHIDGPQASAGSQPDVGQSSTRQPGAESVTESWKGLSLIHI